MKSWLAHYPKIRLCYFDKCTFLMMSYVRVLIFDFQIIICFYFLPLHRRVIPTIWGTFPIIAHLSYKYTYNNSTYYYHTPQKSLTIGFNGELQITTAEIKTRILRVCHVKKTRCESREKPVSYVCVMCPIVCP